MLKNKVILLVLAEVVSSIIVVKIVNFTPSTLVNVVWLFVWYNIFIVLPYFISKIFIEKLENNYIEVSVKYALILGNLILALLVILYYYNYYLGLFS